MAFRSSLTCLQLAVRSIQRLPNNAQLSAVERIVEQAIKRECQAFNRKKPEVIVLAYEQDPAYAAKVMAALGKAVGSEEKDKKSRKKVCSCSIYSVQCCVRNASYHRQVPHIVFLSALQGLSEGHSAKPLQKFTI